VHAATIVPDGAAGIVVVPINGKLHLLVPGSYVPPKATHISIIERLGSSAPAGSAHGPAPAGNSEEKVSNFPATRGFSRAVPLLSSRPYSNLSICEPLASSCLSPSFL